LPRVIVLGTGGTIASLGRDELDVHEYVDHSTILGIDEVLGRAPALQGLAQIIPVSFRNLPSSAVSIADWLEMTLLIGELMKRHEPVDGIVITHGTSTLEETAYFLHLALKTSCSVVMTGSHRPLSAVGSDAIPNLTCAVRVAASPLARGLGVLVVLSDEIHAAREVTKASSASAIAFRTPDVGMLGYVDPAGAVALYRRTERSHTVETPFDTRAMHELPRVDIVYSYIGSDGSAIPAFVASGARAIVSAGFPPDLPTRAERVQLERAQEAGIVIVQCSRAGSGKIARRTALRERGIITADNLTPQKARILAMLALTVTSDPETIQGYFDRF
jgi:L-asparaginase